MSRLLVMIGLAVGALAPTSSWAQYSPTSTYVCQTPRFWCAFVWSSGVRNGTPCYCNTYYGPVSGYSINPANVPDARPLPTPQTPKDLRPPTGRRPAPRDPDIDSDDCYKGLGNCPGSFVASRGRSAGDSLEPRTSRSARSGFSEALQELVDAADSEFSDVRGERRRGTSLSDTYSVTVVPSGFERCVLFLRHRRSSPPRVHCFSYGLRYREVVRRVTDMFGPSDEQDRDEQTWFRGGAEISVEDDDGDAGLTVRAR